MPDGKIDTWLLSDQRDLDQNLQITGAQYLEKDGLRFLNIKTLMQEETYKAIPKPKRVVKNIQIADSTTVYDMGTLNQNDLNKLLSRMGAIGLQVVAPSTTYSAAARVVRWLTRVDELQDNKKYWFIFSDYPAINKKVR